MSTHYEAPVEVRELEKLINNFTYQYGLDIQNVFRDFLRYTVNLLSIPGSPPLSDWSYTKEQNGAFYKMFATWIGIMDKQIKIHGWYDGLGPLFLTLVSTKGQQYNGQFFSSESISRLITEMTIVSEPEIPTIYDPAVGSGQMLLSTKAKKSKAYLVGWDIDYTCCLMCVCNFLINSCVGEVVCIDSLSLNNFRGAWLVNESYYQTELPSIRWLNEQEYANYKRANIPEYVFFLDQEKKDEYFKIHNIWRGFMALFDSV